MERRTAGILAGCMTLALAIPPWPHHSLTAVYDTTVTVTLTGTLTAVDWRNPHVEVSLDVEDVDGTVRSWDLLGASPGFLIRSGASGKEQFLQNIGKTVRAEVHPGKNGTPVGGLLKITFQDDTSVVSVPCC